MALEPFILPKPLLKALGPTEHDDDLRTVIVDLAAAGLIHGYAHSIDEHYYVDHQPVRECGITVEQWRRIIQQELIDEVWDRGTVHLKSDVKNHQFYVEITGIRFVETQVREALADYGLVLAKPSRKRESVHPVANDHTPDQHIVAGGTSLDSKKKVADPAMAEYLTIDETCERSGFARATIYKYISLGDLKAEGPSGAQRVSKTELARWLKNAKQIARTRLDAVGNSR